MSSETNQPETSNCARCGASIQASWKHCPECGSANVPDDSVQHELKRLATTYDEPAEKNPIFAAELDDGDIDITPGMRTKYAIEMRTTGIVMIVLGLLAFVGVLSSLLYSAENIDTFEMNQTRFNTYVGIAAAGILALMAGVIVVTIPSKDGTMSAVTVALGSMLSVALGALFFVVLVLVIIIATIIGFINSCMNACQPT